MRILITATARAELRHNYKWMITIFALIGAVWMGITYLPGKPASVNLSLLAMASAFPLMMSLVICGADQNENRRRALYEALHLSHRERSASHGLVLLTPWPLAMLNALLLLRLSGEAEPVMALAGWGGLLFVLIAVQWLMATWFGRGPALVAGVVTIAAIFTLEAVVIVIGMAVGWDVSFAEDERPGQYLWLWLQQPVTVALLYGAGAVLSLAAIRGRQ